MAAKAQIYAFCLLLFPFSLIPFPFCEAGISTTVESPLQIRLFMQNKAKFRKSQMNVNKVLTRDYEIKTLGGSGKNKANSKPNKAKQSQFKANFTQNKANTKPIQTQSKPISVINHVKLRNLQHRHFNR